MSVSGKVVRLRLGAVVAVILGLAAGGCSPVPPANAIPSPKGDSCPEESGGVRREDEEAC